MQVIDHLEEKEFQKDPASQPLKLNQIESERVHNLTQSKLKHVNSFPEYQNLKNETFKSVTKKPQILIEPKDMRDSSSKWNFLLSSMTGLGEQMPAGRPYHKRENLQKIQAQGTKDLSKFVNDVRGNIPTFGYPLLTYSPSGSGRLIFDKKAWIHGRVSDGKAIKEENTGKIKVFSTAEIKQKLV